MRRSSADAPQGFSLWLDRHLEICAPLNRIRQMPRDGCNAPPLPSVKCWDEHYIHFIYDFPSQLQRDDHVQAHKAPCSRDSTAFSMANSPPFEHPAFCSQGLKPPTRTGPVPQHTRQVVPFKLPPLSLPPQPREGESLSGACVFDNARRGSRRSSGGSDSDPQLPPMKKARLGQARLETIEELRLVRDNGPCLRCRVARNEVFFVA